MDTSTVTAPTLHMSAPDTWKAQKRIPERDTGVDDEDDIALASSNIETNQKKRFRSADSASCFESPVNGAVVVRPKKLFLSHNDNRFSDNVALSPITEISMNMSETTLDPRGTGMCGSEEEAADGTPLKSWRNSQRSGSHKVNHLTRMLIEKDQKSTIQATPSNAGEDDSEEQQREKESSSNAEPNASSASSRFQMSRSGSAGSARAGARRLNMESSLQEMAVDELSFYDDEASSHQHRSFTASPQLMGLLSPEGSPQRFQIVDKAAAASSAKFLQPQARSHKQGGRPGASAVAASAQSTTSSNTPAKSFRMFHSLSSGSMESSMDDEYMELFEMESLEAQTQSQLGFPSDLNSLICGQIKNSSATSSACKSSGLLTRTPEMRRPSVRRCLSMTENQQQQQHPQPKTPELLKQVQDSTLSTTPFASRLSAERSSHGSHGSSNCCFKRPEPPSTTCSPVQCKRYRGEEKENLNGSYIAAEAAASPPATNQPLPGGRPSLRKCMSMNDAEIMSALARSDCKDQPDLIGDFSKPFALPLMDGRHQDLKSVSSDTVARLLNGEFDDQVESYKIIDCRYPYEFEGGHIRGAKNLYTQEQIIEEFLTQQKTEQQQARSEAAGHKRNIIIFHCEFSSERGPKLSRFLRNNDRARNTNAYPALDYPEIYLLHNGYKEFYETHAELCDPVAYRPMLEPSYSEAYRHFRAKSKSWNGDGLGGATSRLKKSRSRLLL